MSQARLPIAARMAAWIAFLEKERMLTGLLCSITLHTVFIALALLLRQYGTPPLIAQQPLVVVQADLVPLAETGVSPPTTQKGLVPQQRAPETAKQNGTGIPRPNDKFAAAAHEQAETSAQKPARAQTGESARAKPQASGDGTSANASDLEARLEAFAQLREPPSREKPDPRQQEGPGTSNVLAADANSPRGPTAAYGIKDFIRAQIQRHWYLAPGMPVSNSWMVSLHLAIDADGTVSSAEVVDGQHPENKDYEEFAQSFRNAALLSSPLQLLPGSYDLVKDITITFTPHEARQ
jgi:hypothetical protein